MVELDESVRNLERFIAQLVASTGGLEKADENFKDATQKFEQLEGEAAEEGGGLNDELEEVGTALDTGRNDATEALTSLAHAATDGQTSTEEAHGRIDQAAGDVEEKAQAILTRVDEAHDSLTAQGFEASGRVLDEEQQELEAASHQVEQAVTELETAVAGFETESQTAWDAAETELEGAATSLGEGGSDVETAASEGVTGFQSAGTEFEQKCSELEQAIELVYDVLDSAVADEGQQWDDEAQRIAKEAVAFVEDGSQQRLEQPATLVEDEALAALSQEYSAVGPVLDAGAATAGELEPLAEELGKCVTIVGQIDDLMNSLAG